MQHSKGSKCKGSSPIGDSEDEEWSKNQGSQEQDPIEPPDYFGKYTVETSKTKSNNNQPSYWKIDWSNGAEENFEIVDQAFSNLVVTSEDDKNETKLQEFNDNNQVEIANRQRIDIDGAKVKSFKPKNKIMMKNLQHLNVANMKNQKDTALKGKQKKNINLQEKQNIKTMAPIAKIESKETFPNSSDSTLETKHVENHNFNKSGPFQAEQHFHQEFENEKMDKKFSKPKTKSQLSLKSKAYTKPGENTK